MVLRDGGPPQLPRNEEEHNGADVGHPSEDGVPLGVVSGDTLLRRRYLLCLLRTTRRTRGSPRRGQWYRLRHGIDHRSSGASGVDHGRRLDGQRPKRTPPPAPLPWPGARRAQEPAPPRGPPTRPTAELDRLEQRSARSFRGTTVEVTASSHETSKGSAETWPTSTRWVSASGRAGSEAPLAIPRATSDSSSDDPSDRCFVRRRINSGLPDRDPVDLEKFAGPPRAGARPGLDSSCSTNSAHRARASIPRSSQGPAAAAPEISACVRHRQAAFSENLLHHGRGGPRRTAPSGFVTNHHSRVRYERLAAKYNAERNWCRGPHRNSPLASF